MLHSACWCVQRDESAINELVEHNLRFVVQVALKYQGHGLPLSDLINAGNLGLMHAARKFDPTRGPRFMTYMDGHRVDKVLVVPGQTRRRRMHTPQPNTEA